LLEYAYQESSEKLVHITEAETGKNCGCVCPHCKDTLTAKNGDFKGRKKEFFFAHQNFKESRSCLMTQLHKVAQQYFLNIDIFTLPSVSFTYNNHTLSSFPKKVIIRNATLEFSVGDFYADVKLETSIGIILIEIAVTSKNKDRKNDYYIANKIPSLEYDLSKLIDLPIEKALDEMISIESLVNWTYEWNKETLIAKHIEKERQAQLNRVKEAEDLRAEQDRLLKEEPGKNKLSAKKAINRILASKSLRLPQVKEEFEYKIGQQIYKNKITLISEKEVIFDKIISLYDEDEYFILEGIKFSIKDGSKHIIYLIYIFSTDYLLPIIDSFNGSILINMPKSLKNNNKKSFWKWYKNIKLEDIRLNKYSEFIKECKFKNSYALEVKNYNHEIEQLSSRYLKLNLYTSKKYQLWRNDLIQKSLFIATESNPKPKFPEVIRRNKNHPQLWMFQEWYILVFMKLAEIIDKVELFTMIDSVEVFDELAAHFKLHPRYKELFNSALSKRIDIINFDKVNVIESSLYIFNPKCIRTTSSGIKRVDKLSLQFKC
jgi:hypothetical protein